jgi:hypothetical protein
VDEVAQIVRFALTQEAVDEGREAAGQLNHSRCDQQLLQGSLLAIDRAPQRRERAYDFPFATKELVDSCLRGRGWVRWCSMLSCRFFDIHENDIQSKVVRFQYILDRAEAIGERRVPRNS